MAAGASLLAGLPDVLAVVPLCKPSTISSTSKPGPATPSRKLVSPRLDMLLIIA
jgi:hypothetical protein